MPEKSDEPLDVTEHFNEDRAEIYDDLIRQAIPGYETLHHMSRLLLRADIAGNSHILVVGAGTGMDILNLGREFPGSTITGVDPSPDMLAVAEKRIERGGLKGRVDLVHGYVGGLDQSKMFDAATLLLVMQFVPDDEASPGGGKLGLLKSIASRLKPGAPLVLADLYGEAGTDRFRHFIGVYREWQLDAGMDEEEVERGFERIENNIQHVSEERTIELLAEAGFRDAQSFFEALLFGGWIAWKA